jgi:hypothetical protein
VATTYFIPQISPRKTLSTAKGFSIKIMARKSPANHWALFDKHIGCETLGGR